MERIVISVSRGNALSSIVLASMHRVHAIPWGDVRVDAATGYTYSWTIEDILTQLLLIE